MDLRTQQDLFDKSVRIHESANMNHAAMISPVARLGLWWETRIGAFPVGRTSI